ncbi:MAG: Helix-turn-helix domain protein [Syntrophorhabdus sp. PtaU1.Bin153]|nr:MAG: Helix-turn-helix domain protein [Syntrophorhabdus sp. PtaU1.Bin153]
MKREETRTFNPDMLVVARKSRGMTQGELAGALSITSPYLSKIEAGMKPFPETKLDALCDILRYQKDFFFRAERFLGMGPAFVYHRMRQSVSSKLLEKVEAQVNVYRMHVEKLLRSVEIAECKIPSYDLDELGKNGTPENIARTIRASWYLPSGPIRDLVKIVESVGGIVIPYDFGTMQIDGVSQRVPPLPPLFFINSNIPADRWRFSLAHELGHIILHDTPRHDMETEAHRFAAELLMPAKEIAPSLRSLTLNKLLDLKLYWKCSMQAIVKKAKDIGAIPERTAYYLFAQLSKAGYRINEPGEFPREQPTLLTKIVEVYLDKLGYTSIDLCNLLAIYPNDFNVLYSKTPEKGHLRLAT